MILTDRLVFGLPALAYVFDSERVAFTNGDPYPFLDPAQVGGARGVAAYVGALLLGFVMVGAGALDEPTSPSDHPPLTNRALSASRR